MKILLVMITVCLTSLLNAQDLEGNWNGKLNIQGQEMAFVFHFMKLLGTFLAPVLLGLIKTFPSVPSDQTLNEKNF